MYPTPKLSILVPARGRPEKLDQLLQSYRLNATPGHAEILFRIDQDDPVLLAYFGIPEGAPDAVYYQPEYTVMVGPRLGYRWLCTMFDELARLSTGTLLMCGNDDMVFVSAGFDQDLLAAAAEYPDGIFELDGDTTTAWPIFPFTTVSRTVFEILGFIYDPRILWGDRWLHDVMSGLDRNIMVRAAKIAHAWDSREEIHAVARPIVDAPDYWDVHRKTADEAMERLRPYITHWPVGSRLVLHVVGLPHTEITRAFNTCAYTQKVRNLTRMLADRGHTVYLYGAGDATDAHCTEYIPVFSTADRQLFFPDAVEGQPTPPAEQIQYDPALLYWQRFNDRTVAAIRRRITSPDDFVCLSFGTCHQPIADKMTVRVVEPGVGYLGVLPHSYKCYESIAWRHQTQGWNRQMQGSVTDTVIPNYFDPADFEVPFDTPREDYFLYIGRLTTDKGVGDAVDACVAAGVRLIVAGEGPFQPTGSGVEYVGRVDADRRRDLMAKARAVFVLTRYVAPFEGVHAEAMLCGTPVITTDFGVFTETVVNYFNGFRCNTVEEIHLAMDAVTHLQRNAIRQFALDKFSMPRVAPHYERWFQRLLKCTKVGTSEHLGDLETLRKTQALGTPVRPLAGTVLPG